MTISEAGEKLATAEKWMSKKVEQESEVSSGQSGVKYSDCQTQFKGVKNQFDIMSPSLQSGEVTPKVQKLLEKDFVSSTSDYPPQDLLRWIDELIGAFYFMYHPEKEKMRKIKKGLFVVVIIITLLLSIAALIFAFVSDVVPENVKTILKIFSIDGFAGAVLQSILALREWWSDQNEIISFHNDSVNREIPSIIENHVDESVNQNSSPMKALIVLAWLGFCIYLVATVIFLLGRLL